MHTEDFYGTLGVSHDVSSRDLRQAFLRLAVQCHPDKQAHSDSTTRSKAEAQFRKVHQAYKVLSDPTQRAVYDFFGPAARCRTQTDDWLRASVASKRKRAWAFADTQSTAGVDLSPASLDSPGHSPSSPGTTSSLGSPPASCSTSSNDSTFNDDRCGKRRLPQQIEVALTLTLEELYQGCTKHMALTRQVLCPEAPSGVKRRDEILQIAVVPGWKEGTRVTFKGLGDEAPGCQPSDIVFVVREELHPAFERRGHDLYTRVQVPLVTALTGGLVEVAGLDQSRITVPLTSVVAPQMTTVIRGQGMPCANDPGRRGDLHVVFEVAFPTQLTEQQKQGLKQALS